MSAYSELYVETARESLGCMLFYAVSVLGWPLAKYYRLFLGSSYASRYAEGDPSVAAGLSGSEVLVRVLEESGVEDWLCDGGVMTLAEARRKIRTAVVVPDADYWTGWALGYYQWASGLTFAEIDEAVSVDDVRNCYSPYHEMDIVRFCEEMDRMRDVALPGTNLGRLRQKAGLSQGQLALLAGVPVRTIQQYEQRQKSINRASMETVVALAKALGCNPTALMEHARASSYEYAVVKL